LLPPNQVQNDTAVDIARRLAGGNLRVGEVDAAHAENRLFRYLKRYRPRINSRPELYARDSEVVKT
jgi:hypothetical protein